MAWTVIFSKVTFNFFFCTSDLRRGAFRVDRKSIFGTGVGVLQIGRRFTGDLFSK
jgi:hypothetical protein